ncbi:hypothetical protein ABPG75_006071 [Micractinium tetrahymenae]
MQPAGSPAGEDDAELWHSYAVTLAYDGTDYWGWQLQAAPAVAAPQPGGGGGAKPAKRQPRPRPTIQLRLEQALTKVTGEPREVLKVQAAGRTDAGVHARGQVAQFCARRRRGRPPLAPAALLRALNALLPPNIRAVAAREVPLDFNVRYALRKTYSYDLDLAPMAADPFLHRFRHRPRHPERLRLEAMADAAQLLVGTHDFSNFANVSADGSHARKNPVKTILRYQLLPIEGGARLEVEGTGFLYKQVRHMTGALLAVGSGQLGPDAIAAALAAGGQARTGAQRHAWRGWTVAEARGLCLQAVEYPAASELLLPPEQRVLPSSDED